MAVDIEIQDTALSWPLLLRVGHQFEERLRCIIEPLLLVDHVVEGNCFFSALDTSRSSLVALAGLFHTRTNLRLQLFLVSHVSSQRNRALTAPACRARQVESHTLEVW